MLPRPRRLGHAQARARTGGEGAHDVGHDAILSIIATADDIAAARGDQRDAVRREVGLRVSAGDDLGGGLGGGVGVLAAKRIVFGERPAGLAIVVDLVGGDDEDALERRAIAQRVEQMREAKRVDRDRLDRLGDGAAHQRLGREMEHDFRVGRRHGGAHGLRIAQIAEVRIEIAADVGEMKERGVCVGGEREASPTRRSSRFRP